jgi:hypothetical protein
MNFSAAELIKRSAAQLVFVELRKRKFAPTRRQLAGNAYAEAVAVSEFLEMRGTYAYGENLIHFSFDEIRPTENGFDFVEVKMVDNPNDCPGWYRESSLLQLAFYAALASRCEAFHTAKFARKQYQVKHLCYNMPGRFLLHFGQERYEVLVDKVRPLIMHLCDKTDVIKTLDYNTAREWDAQYKHREFKLLEHCFHWDKLQGGK